MPPWPDAPCAQLIARGHWGEDEQLQRCTAPIGPRNSWSNLSYGLSGLATAWLHWSPEGFLFLLAMLALCYGSWRYHAQKTLRANLLDRIGMFMVLVPLAVLGAAAFAPIHVDAPVAMVLGAITLGPLAVYFLPLSWMDAQIGACVAVGAAGGVVHGNPWLTGLAMALFVAGYVCWHLDKRPARPLGLWGHAIWHLLTGPAFGLLFLGLVG